MPKEEGPRDPLSRALQQALDKNAQCAQELLEAAFLAKLADGTLAPGDVLDIHPNTGFRACRNRDQLLVVLCLIESEREFKEMRPHLLFCLHHPHWAVRRAALAVVLSNAPLWDKELSEHIDGCEKDPHPIIRHMVSFVPKND